ncbi:hypothetical protein N44_04693 [Microcystis aeruginosa NIES-44]|uniref:Uncharacterized protein n=1 Tax=Microcystis aeruginosa NIES-44 TaxID=449439 RepID=A0A0A1W1A2_MICAE|nr:hypothetical protein N44_04693 [Microcystis aeruginosa NIES-44]
MLKTISFPPYQGGQGGSAPPYQGGQGGSAPPYQGGIKGGRGDISSI